MTKQFAEQTAELRQQLLETISEADHREALHKLQSVLRDHLRPLSDNQEIRYLRHIPKHKDGQGSVEGLWDVKDQVALLTEMREAVTNLSVNGRDIHPDIYVNLQEEAAKIGFGKNLDEILGVVSEGRRVDPPGSNNVVMLEDAFDKTIQFARSRSSPRKSLNQYAIKVAGACCDVWEMHGHAAPNTLNDAGTSPFSLFLTAMFSALDVQGTPRAAMAALNRELSNGPKK